MTLEELHTKMSISEQLLGSAYIVKQLKVEADARSRSKREQENRMADIVQFGIDINSDPLVKGVRSAKRSLDQLNKSQEKTAKATQLMANAVKVFAAFRVASGIINNLVGASEAFERSSAKLNSVLVATGCADGRTADQRHSQPRSFETITR